MLTRDFIFDALYSPTDGYFGTKGEQVRAHLFAASLCGLWFVSVQCCCCDGDVVGCDLASSLCCGVLCVCATAAAAAAVVVVV